MSTLDNASKIINSIKEAAGTSYVSKELKIGAKYPDKQGQTDVYFRDNTKWMSISMTDKEIPAASVYTLGSLPGGSLLD